MYRSVHCVFFTINIFLTRTVLLLTILPSELIHSFLLGEGKCFNDGNCGLGKCDRDNRCRCYLGWRGDFCGEHDDLAVGTILNPCDHFICQHGTCHSYGGERICKCDYKWSGIICDIPFGGEHLDSRTTAPTTSTTRSHGSRSSCGHHYCYHGHCYNYNCHCDNGWSDYQCSTDESLCNQGNCHHGDCFNSKCNCHTGWAGSTCNVKTHEYTCDGQACHHGNCEWSSNGRQRCRCFYGWTGQDCNTEESVSYSHCGNTGCHHGKCLRYDYYHYGCQCYPGWRGSSCSQIDPQCFETYCFHGVCHRDLSRSEHYCICDEGWSGRDCNMKEPPTTTTQTTTTSTPRVTTSTTTKPPTTKYMQPVTTKTLTTTSTSTHASPTTSTTTTTTTTPLHAGSCSKVSVVSDIANSQISTNQNAVSCVSGNKTSPEALVLTHCNLTSPTKWREGVNVMANCSSIPPYTPIATFGSHRYSSAGTLCGIFIGCLQNGFQMAVQYCDQPPSIEHVETNNGLFARDPTTYFTIME